MLLCSLFGRQRPLTDPGGKGVKIVIEKTDDELCPVQAIFKYLRRRGGQEGPLFLRENSTPLTKPYFVKCVREALKTMGYDEKTFSGHSFRAGAATTAAAQNIQDSIIKTLGRWRVQHIYCMYEFLMKITMWIPMVQN